MVDMVAGTGSRRTLLLRCAAVLAVAAAVIHFAVAGAHFQEYWAFGVFMLVAGWAQLIWAIWVTMQPSRALLIGGGVLNAAIAVVYVVTRTVGDVIGPTPISVEPVGFGDMFCTICEVTIVLVVALLLLRRFERAVSRSTTNAVLASVSTAMVVLLSLALVDGGPEMVMSMDASAATPAISLPTNSPAGPVTMPQPGMQMEPGMQMTSDSCTTTPTGQQRAAAVALVNRSWAAAKKYQSLSAAKAAGFRPVTPIGGAVVHYINQANYLATRLGGPVLDPSAPQSLVYANTPTGAVLVAVMYIAPRRSGTPPTPGGCLTQWHVHTNLCFSRATRSVVGITDPTCPAGSVNRVSPPMLHVWFVPIPGGPTAVDASNTQIVRAAERVPAGQYHADRR